MFPVYLKDEELRGPINESLFFLLANNGLFLIKEMDLYRASLKMEGVPGLLSHEESFQLKVPKLPKALVETGMGFFSVLYHLYQSEGILLLFYSPTAGFHVEAPKQSVYLRGPGRPYYMVDYENPPTPEGFSRLGTWHSHAMFPAYHSREDRLDEMGEDGLHIVVGDLDLAIPSFSFSFMINGRRFFLNKEEVIEGYDRSIFPPEDWVENVSCVDSLDPFEKRSEKESPHR